MPRKTPRNWLDGEPGFAAILPEMARLFRRARQRAWLTLALTMTCSALLVAAVYFKKRTFAPQVVLRAVEADQQAGVAPRPKRKLRDHVQQAVFSNQQLAEIIERHGLYPSLAKKNPQAALASFKEDIAVDVYRNFFVEERMPNDPPRSARIAISYRSVDRQLALDVARELAALVADHETKSRQAQIAIAARDAGAELGRARAELIEQRRQIAQRTLEVQQSGSAEARVALANLQRSLANLERRVSEAEARKAVLELNASLEAEQLGLRFQVVDSGAIPERAVLQKRDLLWLGLFGFIFGLPFVALAVGAFDGRIRDTEDLRRLGAPVLGQVRISNQKTEGYA